MNQFYYVLLTYNTILLFYQFHDKFRITHLFNVCLPNIFNTFVPFSIDTFCFQLNCRVEYAKINSTIELK